jgi:hypothetical protein
MIMVEQTSSAKIPIMHFKCFTFVVCLPTDNEYQKLLEFVSVSCQVFSHRFRA